MKVKKILLLVLLTLILIVSINAISAENATDMPLTAEENDILGDTNGTVETATNDSSTDLKEDNETVIFTEYKNKDNTDNIYVSAKAETNTGKVGEKILYTVKVTNKNLFDVYDLYLFMGEYESYAHFALEHNKGYYIFDDAYIVINKLCAGETKIIKMQLMLWEPGETSIETLVGAYDYKSKIRTILKTPKVTKKYIKTKITYKANKKPVKKLKVKVKVYTGKYYKIYKLKTNKKGIIKLKTKYLSKGKHKIVFKSLNKKYSLHRTFKIRI